MAPVFKKNMKKKRERDNRTGVMAGSLAWLHSVPCGLNTLIQSALKIAWFTSWGWIWPSFFHPLHPKYPSPTVPWVSWLSTALSLVTPSNTNMASVDSQRTSLDPRGSGRACSSILCFGLGGPGPQTSAAQIMSLPSIPSATGGVPEQEEENRGPKKLQASHC